MKRFTEAGITLEPRSIGACIDLAFRFISQEWPRLLVLILSCALPLMGLTLLIARTTDYGWAAALSTTLFGSVALGSLLVTHAAAIAFHQPLTAGQYVRYGLWQPASTLIFKCLLRVAAVILAPIVIPSIMLAVVGSFRTESRVLKSFRSSQHEHRTRDLVRQEFSDLLLRMSTLLVFGSLLWLVMTMTLDATCKLLFDTSPVFGPLREAAEDPWGYLDFEQIVANMWTTITTDGRILSALVLANLLTYAILRLAWFFTYIDLRIRRDCWDLEVALADEAQRWEAPA